jgi:hypothetical protein
MVREAAQAKAVIVIVFGGNRGDGFPVQAPITTTAALPDLLESLATLIRADVAADITSAPPPQPAGS